MDKSFKVLSNDSVLIHLNDGEFIDYKIISEDENGYTIIRVLPKVVLKKEFSSEYKKVITTLKVTNDIQYKSDPDNAYNYYFAIKSDEFKPLSKSLLSAKIVGVPIIYPFRLRPKKSPLGAELYAEFTASYNFGIRLKATKNPLKQNFITPIFYGCGLSAEQYFTGTVVKDSLTSKDDAVSITYFSCGLLYTTKKINFGAFWGFDAMIGRKRNWFYQNMPWFSFGIGYKFGDD